MIHPMSRFHNRVDVQPRSGLIARYYSASPVGFGAGLARCERERALPWIDADEHETARSRPASLANRQLQEFAYCAD